jgi:ATP-dependent helicase/nuclease subunit A
MNSLCEHRDFPETWRRDPFDRNNRIDTLVSELARLGPLAAESSWPEDPLASNLADIARFIGETGRLEQVSGRDYDGLEAELRSLARLRSWRARGTRARTFGDLTRDEVLARRDQVKSNLDAFVVASDADLAPLLHQALMAPIAEYELLKTRAGRLDFLDLLIKARNLIRDNDTVRNELQRRYSPHRDPFSPLPQFRRRCHPRLCARAGSPARSSRSGGRALVSQMRGSHRPSQRTCCNRMAR